MIKGKPTPLDELRERTRKRAEAHSRERGLSTLFLPEGVNLFETAKGTTEFDILPYRISVDNHPDAKKGEIWYKRLYFIHRDIGPEELTIVCPKTVGKRCPICDEYKKLKSDPDVEEDVVKALRPKERELFNIIMKGENSVMILDISTNLFGQELDKMINEGEVDIAGFWLLQGGMTLKVRWDVKTMPKRKPFYEAGRIDFLPRDDFDDSVLDVTVDLDKALKIMEYEELDAIFQGGAETTVKEEEQAPAEEEKPPARRVIGRRPVQAPAEEEQPPAEEEQEEPRPARTVGKARPEAEAEEDLSNLPDCIACEGTGKTSKGKDCPICGGSGKDKDAAPAEEEQLPAEEEQEQPARPARRVVGRGAPAAPAAGGRRIIRR